MGRKKCSGNIIWLASYPKSGNTWTRIFLHALKSGEPLAHLAELDSTEGISSSRDIASEWLGVDSMDLPLKDIRKLRREIFIKYSDSLQSTVIKKTHEKPFAHGMRIIPHEATKKVILIIRNPFDMIGSYANHMNVSINRACKLICSEFNTLAANDKAGLSQLDQHLASWGTYNQEWLNVFGDEVFVMKYESLKQAPFQTFKSLVRFLEWDYSDEQIKMAVQNSEFKKLQSIETVRGFAEKPLGAQNFFRKGKLGGWRDEISQEMADTIVDKHYDQLLKLEYIDKDRNILV